MARTLRHQDAWRAALAWHEQLERRVRLEVDLNECDDQVARVAPSRFTVVDRFEWVTFVFNGFYHEGFRAVGNVTEIVAAARAATIVWYALTCCPGFSGTENPDFWRGVFTELAPLESNWRNLSARRAQLAITEAVRFFDDPDKPFPRVRLVPKPRDAEQYVRGFVQTPPSGGESTNSVQRELDRILATLAPYIRPSRWSRAIPVAVDEVSATTIAEFLPRLQLRCTPSPQGPLMPPEFRLESIYLQGKDLASPDLLRRLVVFSHAKMVVRRCDSADVRALLSAPEGTRAKLRDRVHVSTVDLIRPLESASHFAAMCAAIPSSEWISAGRVFSFGVPNPKDRIYQTNVAWLAYAIFHPDTASNHMRTMADLEISSYRFPMDLIRIFRSMSIGNNLLAVMSGDSKTPLANAYFSGLVVAGTVARAKPNRFSHSVHSFRADQWVTICTTTEKTRLMDSWVGAVVPGIGLAWIRKEAIRSVAKRAPAASCLRRLRLTIGEDPHAALLSLLGILGNQLEYLDVAECTFHATPTESIMRLCPRLKTLRIAYATEFWSDETSTASTVDFPELDELEVHLSNERPPRFTMEPLRSPILSKLTTLRAVVRVPNVFLLSRDSFLSTLNTFPNIQYAHWYGYNGSISRQIAAPEPDVSYRVRQHQSLKRLGDLAVWSGNILDGPTKLRDRIAFLSVVRRESLREGSGESSAVGRLDPDILWNIFSFTSAKKPREVYISDGEVV